MATRARAAEPSARYLAVGRVLVDSGPLIALFNAADRWHAPVLQWLQAHPQAQLISTWSVATEVCALLARRIHNEAALDFLRWAQRGGITLDHPEDTSLPEVLSTDASIAEAAARLKLRHVLSIDADFDVYRDRNGKVLVNLLAR